MRIILMGNLLLPSGVPGDEKGFVVAMLDDDLWTDGRTPPVLQPGTRIRITSQYDASQKRLGVMGLLTRTSCWQEP